MNVVNIQSEVRRLLAQYNGVVPTKQEYGNKALGMCRDFQREGAEFLSKRRYAMIADSVGLGKTVQAIAAMDTIHANNALIICPGIARDNWLRELHKFSSRLLYRDVHIVKSSKDFLHIKPGSTMIISYNLSTKIPNKFKFDVTILDEAHSVKNRGTQRTEILLFKPEKRLGKQKRNKHESVFQRSERVWSLTATPTPNNPMEIYSISRAYNVHTMNKWDFINYWCDTYVGPFENTETLGLKSGKDTEFRAFMELFCLRRTKDQVGSELPPLIYNSIEVKGKNMKDVKAAESDLDVASVDDLLKEAVHMATLRRLYGLKKVDGTTSFIKEQHSEGIYKKTIIFCHHREVLARTMESIKDLNPVEIHGGTNKNQDESSMARFQNDPECKAVVISLKKGNAAINLQAADSVVFLELDWVPGNNTQAAGRAHRMGQKNSHVHVVFVTLEDCEVDVAVTQRLREKSSMIDSYLKRDEVSDLSYDEHT